MKTITSFLWLFLFTLLSCSKKITIQKDNYSLKTFDNSNNQAVDLSGYKSPNTRIGQDSSKIVIVCASGGGSRAAAFTIGVLLELEKLQLHSEDMPIDSQNNILNQIDYFSTTSGGGWGSSAFIAYKYQNLKYKNDYKIPNPFPTFNSFETDLQNISDFRYAKYQGVYALSSLGKRSDWVYMNRLNVGYLGWGYRANIEDSLYRIKYGQPINTNNVNEIVLSDVFKPASKDETPILPMIIPNTANIDNFKLVPFTPDRLKWWGVNQYIDLFGSSIPELSTGPLTDSDLYDIPLASGIKASSCVPGFINASYFKSKKAGIDYYLHLEDGGIVDNQGVYTAKAILNQNIGVTDPAKRIVIIIDASGAGIQNENRFKKLKLSRLYCAKRTTLYGTPDAQYPLMRERIRAMEQENHCTVIYLGTEVLLDPNFGKKDSLSNFSEKEKNAEDKFYKMYSDVVKDSSYFRNASMKDRSLLYEYIKTKIPTWFSSKHSANKGKYLVNSDEARGTAEIMFLAGRGVVQLKRDVLLNAFNK